MRSLPWLMVVMLGVGCIIDKVDHDVDPDCSGSSPISVSIGQRAGDEFIPLESGHLVGLDVAPQGGFGVSVQALTTGLKADDQVDVTLITEIGGERSGEFLAEDVSLYCEESGHGLLWDVVPGFDPTLFETNDDLLNLDGQTVDLVLEITDIQGDVGVGRVSVVIEVGS